MKKRAIWLILAMVCCFDAAIAQRQATAKTAYLVNIIDSLDGLIAEQKIKIGKLESSLEQEKASADEMREKLAALDEEKKKLESNVDAYQGENLKLSQSNRILIVFNSFVAVLLIVTLVFYLRKMNRKPVSVVGNSTASKPVAVSNHSVHASFEDKLQQLERLGKLREKGFLSDDEFLSEKNRVLGK